MLTKIKVAIFVLILIASPIKSALGQNYADSAALSITKEYLKEVVKELTAPSLKGRATGSAEMAQARSSVISRLYQSNAETFGSSYASGFYFYSEREGKMLLGVNLIGIIRADSSVTSPKNIIIGANYDSRGEINGQIYPGADNNASGVAAMLSICNAASQMKQKGEGLKSNIWFVAFDAHHSSMEGARYFLNNSGLKAEDISLMINLSQIGTTLSPPKEAKTEKLIPKNYLCFMGESSKEREFYNLLKECNSRSSNPLVLENTFETSPLFYGLFYPMCDQILYKSENIPSVLITSGIHKYTNNPSDDFKIINFNALTERCRLLFKAVWSFANKE